MAGKVLVDIKRELDLEDARIWVLSLPMAIRIRHNTVDPESGYYPERLVFGMDRPGFGIPWAVVRESREAAEWMAHREKLQQEAGNMLWKTIDDNLRRASHRRAERMFQEVDRVWLKKPKGITGPGILPNLLAPYVVTKLVWSIVSKFPLEGADRRHMRPSLKFAWRLAKRRVWRAWEPSFGGGLLKGSGKL